MLKSIGVFCGSSEGTDPAYREAAFLLGKTLADQGISLVYGGGKVGLMGVVADAVLEFGGEAIGVMPRALADKEIAHAHLSSLHIVADMHERKAKIAALSDAFITLPGGAGTMDEFFEQWTWAQLGIHTKPCAFLNTAQFYAPLLQMARKMVSAGFLKQTYLDMLIVEEEPALIIEKFHRYSPPVRKWDGEGATR